MKTFFALLAFCAGNSPVNYPHRGQWRGALMFSLICAWINSWVNNHEHVDLRRNSALYDVIVMPIESQVSREVSWCIYKEPAKEKNNWTVYRWRTFQFGIKSDLSWFLAYRLKLVMKETINDLVLGTIFHYHSMIMHRLLWTKISPWT